MNLLQGGDEAGVSTHDYAYMPNNPLSVSQFGDWLVCAHCIGRNLIIPLQLTISNIGISLRHTSYPSFSSAVCTSLPSHLVPLSLITQRLLAPLCSQNSGCLFRRRQTLVRGSCSMSSSAIRVALYRCGEL